MDQLITQLKQLQGRARMLLVIQRGSVLLAWTLGVALALVLLDYLLRLPGPIRLVHLAGGLGVLAWRWRRDLVPAVRFRPSLTQLALRVESAVPALSGRLASSVEFALAGTDHANPLAARAVRDTTSRAAGAALQHTTRPGRTVRDAFIAAGIVLVAVLAVVSSPALARTGIERLLLPLGSAQWPARTAVASLMDEVLGERTVYRRGQSLVLRAANRTLGDPGGAVEAQIRYQRDGRFGDWSTLLLTHQGDGVHERLVDTEAEAMDIVFATADARTKPERITLVPAPEVVRAVLRVQPPAYASGWIAPLEAELGPGVDDRAVTERSSLAGSEAVLALELSKPLPVAQFDDHVAWLDWADGAQPQVELDAVDGFAQRATIAWRLDETRRIALTLADEHGLVNDEDIGYRITVFEDLLPSVTLTAPDRDEAVLPTALVDVVAEATDDVALESIGVRARRERPEVPAEPLGFAPSRDVAASEGRIAAPLDLAPLELKQGDVVVLHAVAQDRFDLDDVRHPEARSAERRLRIIDEVELVTLLRQHLSGVRQGAIRLDARQGELQDDLAMNSAQPGASAAQAQLAERIAQQRDALDEIVAEMERNRLEDQALENLVGQASDLLDFAGRAATEAVAELQAREAEGPAERGADAEASADAGQPAPEDRAAAEAQQKVRDELADLIELLDRDEDTWVVQRQLESLLEAQQELEQQTGRLAPETIGQSRADLAPEQRDELDRIVARQRELRDEAQRMVEEMRRRAEALEEVDPRSASGMRTAADTGEKRELDRDMETAGERAQENQLQSAAAAQAAANETLERMLEDIEATQRARAEELLRQLDSLLESIKRLVEVQENELIALARGVEADDLSGRDRAMIRLAQNTQAVAASARQAGQDTRRIARALDRAADRQGAAITALRAQPADTAMAQEAEEQALDLLNEALELAEALKEETEEDQVRQKREELVAAYRALMETQMAVRGETQALDTGEPLTRRQLVEARRLGNAERDIRTGLSDLQSTTGELADSEIFDYVHRLMDRWAESVSDALWEGQVDVDVTDRQRMIAESIARQIDALEEQAEQDPLDDGQGGDGGGQGGQGGQPTALIPPVAELRRLKGLQEQVLGETRGIDERSDLDAGQRRQRLRELGTLQRELLNIGQRMLEAMTNQGAPDLQPAPESTGEPAGTDPGIDGPDPEDTP